MFGRNRKPPFLALAIAFVGSVFQGVLYGTEKTGDVKLSIGRGILGEELFVNLSSEKPVLGFSFGIGFDTGKVRSVEAGIENTVLSTLRAGKGPEFEHFREVEGGATFSVVTDFQCRELIPPGKDLPVLGLRFDGADLPPGEEAALRFKDDLGNPPVETLVSYSDGQGIVHGRPETSDGSVSNPHLVTDRIIAPTGLTGESVFVTVEIGNPLVAFSFGLTWDSGLRFVESGIGGTDLEKLRNGKGPEFLNVREIQSQGHGTYGLTAASVFSYALDERIIPGDRPVSILSLVFAAPEGQGAYRTRVVSDLGDPRVESVLVELSGDGDGLIHVNKPDLVEGLVSSSEAPFRRGDCNSDGRTNIADAISILAYLFGPNKPFSVRNCLDAADTNDDGRVNIADALYLLGYVFGGKSQPPAPGPFSCGGDPSPDGLSCLEMEACTSSR